MTSVPRKEGIKLRPYYDPASSLPIRQQKFSSFVKSAGVSDYGTSCISSGRIVNEDSFNSPRLGWCALGVFLIFLQPVIGKGGDASAQNTKNPLTGLSAEAVRVGRAPKLDGTLDDPLWQLAKPITDFRQREPNEGEPATEKTEVRILYTRNAVFFGIHCYDSAPSRIVATELRRDVSQDLDDHFEILINSNHDRRGGYVFEINPLGRKAMAL